MKDPQQTADELVENIGALDIALFYEEIIQLAILHTQGIIDALNVMNELVEFDDDEDKVKLFNHHQQVLTILKTRL